MLEGVFLAIIELQLEGSVKAPDGPVIPLALELLGELFAPLLLLRGQLVGITAEKSPELGESVQAALALAVGIPAPSTQETIGDAADLAGTLKVLLQLRDVLVVNRKLRLDLREVTCRSSRRDVRILL